MNVTLESLKEKHGDKAESIFCEIRDLGGYGNVDPEYVGGLDIYGALDPGNTVIPEHVKDKIAQLSGITRKDADTKRTSGEIITSDQIIDVTPKPPRSR